MDYIDFWCPWKIWFCQISPWFSILEPLLCKLIIKRFVRKCATFKQLSFSQCKSSILSVCWKHSSRISKQLHSIGGIFTDQLNVKLCVPLQNKMNKKIICLHHFVSFYFKFVCFPWRCVGNFPLMNVKTKLD